MRESDVDAAHEVSYESLREAGTRYGWHMPEQDDASRERGHQRIRQCLEHDPDGAFVADRAGEVVGVALATRRGPLWFLSLLAVQTASQAQGIGRELLSASMRTLDGVGLICASDDPKALRRYRRAGFDLSPCFEATGSLRRAGAPAVHGVREAAYDEARELVEGVAREQRGAGHGPELDLYARRGHRLFVADGPAGRGYCVARDTGPVVLGATTAEAATALLWTALLEAREEEVEVGWLTDAQQWALDVALGAGLKLRPTGTLCRRGCPGPLSPFIPSGAFG